MAKVLIVDDDETSRTTFCLGLKDAGYEVELASSGEEACELLETRIPTVILLDLKLPGIDGYAVLKWMRANEVLVPTAAITGFVEQFEPADAMALGAAMYLRKPLFLGDLIDAVALLIRGAVSEQAKSQLMAERPTSHGDSLADLHSRVLLGDPAALEEIAARLLHLVVPPLQRRFPHVAADIVNDAVEDAILEYASRPRVFDPARSVPVSKFVYIASWRNLADLIKKDRRREMRKARFVDHLVGVRTVDANVSSENEVADGVVLLEAAANNAERSALSVWLAGDRSTCSIAEALGMGHLTTQDQRREVKRFKDRILKRISRWRTSRFDQD